MVASGLTEKVVNDKVGYYAAETGLNNFVVSLLVQTQTFDLMTHILHIFFVIHFTCLCVPQTLSFYFPPCGKIPPPVIMVQNVSFKYNDNTVSIVNITAGAELGSLE